MYKSIDVANAFIDIFNKNYKRLTHIKLQKLVYLAHGFWLYLKAEPLVEEPFAAWTKGPICSTLYSSVKQSGNDMHNVTYKLTHDGRGENLEAIDDSDIKMIVQYIFDNFQDWNTSMLLTLTSMEGTAWDKVVKLEEDSYLLNGDIKDEIENFVKTYEVS